MYYVYMCRRHLAALALALFAAVGLPATFAETRSAVDAACATRIDVNRDRYVEVEFIHRIPELGAFPYEAEGNGRGTVLVLVESRLLQPLVGARSLERALQSFVGDLAAEGYHAFALEVKLEPGTKKQHGLTLLGIRRFLQDVYRRDPSLRGAILVGRYPNAFIVRQHFWLKQDEVTLHRGTDEEKVFKDVPYIVSRPEPVSTQADVVLADLDGDWEGVYQRKAKALPYFVAVYPGRDVSAPATDWETGKHTFADFFFVQDGAYAMKETEAGALFVQAGKTDRECAAGDLAMPNPMCRPEIAVSRIDASMVALKPNPKYQELLGKDGRPQAVRFADGKVPSRHQCWVSDPFLERELLFEYFQRNHSYRTGAVTDGVRPACFSLHWASAVPDFTQHVPGWEALSDPAYDLQGDSLTINDWVEWMKRPALVRAIKAHSSPWGSTYGASRDPKALLREVGGHSWGWEQDGDTLRLATFAEGSGNFELYRTLYENRMLPDTPNMFLHTGCDGMTPPLYDRLAFGNENYGKFQGAQALLMYCKGLVLLGRGKVFNDEPRDLAVQLGEGKSWGEAWMHYFGVDAHDGSLDANNSIGITRKKAYFWSLLGDWTLTLRP
jgi:hypothetical protein